MKFQAASENFLAVANLSRLSIFKFLSKFNDEFTLEVKLIVLVQYTSQS